MATTGQSEDVPTFFTFENTGHGIDFSATGDGSGTDSSELFDDYEEGTFTPAYTEGSGGGNALNNVTYNNTTGFYTKIGGCVTFSLRIQSQHDLVQMAPQDSWPPELPADSL